MRGNVVTQFTKSYPNWGNAMRLVIRDQTKTNVLSHKHRLEWLVVKLRDSGYSRKRAAAIVGVTSAECAKIERRCVEEMQKKVRILAGADNAQDRGPTKPN